MRVFRPPYTYSVSMYHYNSHYNLCKRRSIATFSYITSYRDLTLVECRDILWPACRSTDSTFFGYFLRHYPDTVSDPIKLYKCFEILICCGNITHFIYLKKYLNYDQLLSGRTHLRESHYDTRAYNQFYKLITAEMNMRV